MPAESIARFAHKIPVSSEQQPTTGTTHKRQDSPHQSPSRSIAYIHASEIQGHIFQSIAVRASYERYRQRSSRFSPRLQLVVRFVPLPVARLCGNCAFLLYEEIMSLSRRSISQRCSRRSRLHTFCARETYMTTGICQRSRTSPWTLRRLNRCCVSDCSGMACRRTDCEDSAPRA